MSIASLEACPYSLLIRSSPSMMRKSNSGITLVENCIARAARIQLLDVKCVTRSVLRVSLGYTYFLNILYHIHPEKSREPFNSIQTLLVGASCARDLLTVTIYPCRSELCSRPSNTIQCHSILRNHWIGRFFSGSGAKSSEIQRKFLRIVITHNIY